MADTPDQRKPAPESQDASKKNTPKKSTTGMTRKGFGMLLKRAFTPDAAKSDPKAK
jgi:hypothetical protein